MKKQSDTKSTWPRASVASPAPADYLKRYHGNFNSRHHCFCFGNAEGEPNQPLFRFDAAVCVKQKMVKEVNAV